ncbi:MAG: histidine kinase dimerization/phosphoacceptor domain -containing protein [Treponemataceae bacterium]
MTRVEQPAKGGFGAARRIILQCILWYILTAGIFAAFESATVSAKVDHDIAERILTLEKRVEPALAFALWNLDHDLVSLILSGVVDDPAIKRVELSDESGRIITALDALEAKAVRARAGGPPRTFPLTHALPGKSARSIGSLTVIPSAELRMERIRDTFLFSIGRTALLVLILSVILTVAIERGLGRPLREFAKGISEVDPADPDKTPLILHGAPGGELTLAAEAFNGMARKVGETMSALTESRARLWSAFEDSPISLWEEDFSEVKRRVDGEKGVSDWHAYFQSAERVHEFRRLIKIIDVNRSTLALLGISVKSQVLGPLFEAVEEEEILALRQEFIALAYGSLSWEGESVHQTRDGRKLVLRIRLGIVPGHELIWDRVLVSIVDVTEQKRAENVLRQSLAEKELLLKEVHHRVKNNLQIICSLISIQSGTVDPDSETAASLADIESRVWSMALVHELLYETQNFAALDFSGYVKRLCDRIISAYIDAPGRIRISVDIHDDVRLILEKAIPCGLLINELIVNSFKHAFPDGRKGAISVSMARTGDGEIRLVVSDDGVGIGDLSKMRKPKSIGFMLIENLANQLGGLISFRGTDGFQSELRFPDSFKR